MNRRFNRRLAGGAVGLLPTTLSACGSADEDVAGPAASRSSAEPFP
jgi:hypothetical protein